MCLLAVTDIITHREIIFFLITIIFNSNGYFLPHGLLVAVTDIITTCKYKGERQIYHFLKPMQELGKKKSYSTEIWKMKVFSEGSGTGIVHH